MISVPLEPCPFCGGEELSHGSSFEGVWRSVVQCHASDCGAYVVTDGPEEAEAIAAWNRRAAAPSPAGGGVEARPDGVDEAMKVNALAKIVRREMQDNSIHIRERSASAVRAILAALSHPVSGGGELGSLAPLVPTEQAETPVVGEWIPWAGGENPVGESDLVECRFGDGSKGVDEANMWSWESKHAPIIAYRVIPAPAVAPSGGA